MVSTHLLGIQKLQGLMIMWHIGLQLRQNIRKTKCLGNHLAAGEVVCSWRMMLVMCAKLWLSKQTVMAVLLRRPCDDDMTEEMLMPATDLHFKLLTFTWLL